MWKFTFKLLWQKFRESHESKVFTEEVTKELISRKIFLVRENFLNFHTAQCGNSRKGITNLDSRAFGSGVICSRSGSNLWTTKSNFLSHFFLLKPNIVTHYCFKIILGPCNFNFMYFYNYHFQNYFQTDSIPNSCKVSRFGGRDI